MSTPLAHTIIRASAGTGKTHQLANRYIALLLLQGLGGKLSPEKLVAVTFTRKGAGEFAERILSGLAVAAGDAAKRADLRRQLELLINGDAAQGIYGLAPGVKPPIDSASLQRTLAVLVDEFDRLALGTIDSFMARSVQTLGFELGLDGFEILEKPATDRARQELLTEVFREASTKGLETFRQTLKLAVLKSVTSYRRELDRFVTRFHHLLQGLPAAENWGGPDFWNDEETGGGNAHWRKSAAELSEQLASHNFGHKTITSSLCKAMDWLAQRNPATSGDKFPSWLDDGGRLTQLWAEWPQGDWTFEFSKKERTIPASVLTPLKEILGGWLAAERQAFSDQTAAVFDILARYERLYHERLRQRGRLAFDDLPILLAGTGRSALPAELLQLLAFRWFLQFDHWLLDEFQDTSRKQWGVLKPWLDEALQDDSGTKSVFVVGDPKQSIYGWRGGEPRLFEELGSAYPGRFHEQVMAESWRSRPAVLELVNAVCNPARNPALNDPEKFAGSILARWRFDTHQPEPGRAQKPGYAAVLFAPAAGSSGNGDGSEEGSEGANGAAPDKLAAEARVIKAALDKLQPLKNGLSCAILVRKNENAQVIAQWLRTNGVDHVMVEGDARLADESPVVAALVDGLRWLNTPAHTLAGGHIGLTPLWEVLAQPVKPAEERAAPQTVWRHWRQRITEIGAGEVTREWCGQLSRVIRDDYNRHCLRQVDQLAHRLAPALTLPDWLASLEQLTIRETAAAGSIHVMTIHKAKGLGFDIVFLPDLDFGTSSAETMLVRRDEQGVPLGCLLCPPKALRAWMPQLQQLKAQQEAEQDLEALCVLYVALTRAREATFVVLGKEAPNRAARTRDWLLGGVTGPDSVPAPWPWSEGELVWESGSREFLPDGEGAGKPVPPAAPPVTLPAPIPRRERRRPSDAGGDPGKASASSPAPAGSERQAFGTAVHEVFEQIEWWQPGQALAGPSDAVAVVRQCLEDPGIRALFTREAPTDEAWRELPLELIDGNTEWSGVIDRLVLRGDPDGTPRKAIVVDFKTDKVDTLDVLRQRYEGQVEIYRRALALAPGFANVETEVVLVSTHLKAVLVLDLSTSRRSHPGSTPL